MIESGAFRDDLYYRLAAVRVSVPPLRERMEDIEVLARHFLEQSHRPGLVISPEVLAKLCAHTWPGNVRELKNVVERGVALSTGGALTVEDIPGPVGASLASPGTSVGKAVAFQTASGKRKTFRDAKAEAVEAFERAYLTDLIREHDNLSAAAKSAGMDRKHLRVLLRRYGLAD